jgi:hypothetical protein
MMNMIFLVSSGQDIALFITGVFWGIFIIPLLLRSRRK